MSPSDDHSSRRPMGSNDLSAEDLIARKEQRRLKAQQETRHRIWFGLGTFGVIGWSVAIPTVLGALVGMYIDARDQGRRSWTLMLMLSGLLMGCVNVWRWLKQNSEG